MKDSQIEIEIYQGNGGQLRKEAGQIIYPASFSKEGICAWMYHGDGERSYQVGQRFCYPEDAGLICPWLLGGMDSMIQVLWCGGVLPWLYRDTPYEKVIDPDGITTEYVRCIDPTESGIVVKIIRTTIEE
jgi:hypothetical protein